MTEGLDLVFRLAAGLALVVFYYRIVNPLIPSVGAPLARRLGLTARHSSAEASAIVSMVLVGVAHVAFGIALVVILPVRVDALGLGPFPPILAVYGVLLGIAVSGAASLVCRLIMTAAEQVIPRKVPSDLDVWLTIARGGWMRHYVSNVRVLPLPLAVASIGVQIGAEEFVFRSVMLNFYLPAGATATILISAALFALIQVFQMPSLVSAMFPVVGALIMGVVHGILFVEVPFLWPLVIAHLTFFLVSVI